MCDSLVLSANGGPAALEFTLEKKLRVSIIFALAIMLAVSITAVQSARETQPPPRQPRLSETQPAPSPPDVPVKDQDIETIKIDTNLVTVPVIASSRTGLYIADLRKEEFSVSEDGVAQEIAIFTAVSAPFHVVLMLDTSASTEEKLGQIQQAAIEFVDLLNSADRVKVISFDTEVRDLNKFTNDKRTVREAIKQTRSGTGTRLYDAVQTALDDLRPINQRRAIVLFTDGVDWHSDSATFDQTVRALDESGVIVYPIRFDTRAETERIVRQQQGEQNGPILPTSDVIRKTTPGTTPPTFPSDDPPPAGQPRHNTLPSIIFGPSRLPAPQTRPPDRSPTGPFPTPPRQTRTTNPGPNGGGGDDGLSAMLDSLYFKADSYLKELADRSGGQIYRADNVGVLPRAFLAIADELRTQYLLGYYPTNRAHDGDYRKIRVKTSRKDIAIRTRPGYRARTEQ